jgi:hypothetical protein
MARPIDYRVQPGTNDAWDITARHRVVGHADTREAAVDAAIRAAKTKHRPHFTVTVSFRDEHQERLKARARHRPTR